MPSSLFLIGLAGNVLTLNRSLWLQMVCHVSCSSLKAGLVTDTRNTFKGPGGSVEGRGFSRKFAFISAMRNYYC
jgi:hypothetical protein